MNPILWLVPVVLLMGAGIISLLDRRLPGRTVRPICQADQGEPCTCNNGIGCIHVPYDLW